MTASDRVARPEDDAQSWLESTMEVAAVVGLSPRVLGEATSGGAQCRFRYAVVNGTSMP